MSAWPTSGASFLQIKSSSGYWLGIFLIYFIFRAEIGFSKPILITTPASLKENSNILIGNCTRRVIALEQEDVSSLPLSFVDLPEKYAEILDGVHVESPNSKIFEGLKDYQTFKLKNRYRPSILILSTEKCFTQGHLGEGTGMPRPTLGR